MTSCGGADGAQAHRRRDRGVHRIRPAARRDRDGAGGGTAAAARGAERHLHRPDSSDAQVAEALAGARSIAVTAVEESGIAASQAPAAGRPVIAFGGGGVRESVQPRATVVLRAQRPGGAGRDRPRLRMPGRRLRCRPRRGGAVQRAALPQRARGDRGRRRLGMSALLRPEAAAGARGRALPYAGCCAGRRAEPACRERTDWEALCKLLFRSFGERAESTVRSIASPGAQQDSAPEALM